MNADIIVIGGGVIGCSVAWHLRQSGIENVVLIEAGESIASETSAAGAGYVSLWNREPELERYALKFWPELAERSGNDIRLKRNGFLEISDASLDLREMFRAQIGLPATDSQAARPVSLGELTKLVPILDLDAITQAVHFPGSLSISVQDGTRALARNAGKVLLNTTVIGILIRGGRVAGVQTPGGKIEAPVVVNAAGAWIGKVHALAGLPALPMRIYAAARAVSEPLDIPRDFPMMILHYAPDRCVYVREESGGLLFGHVRLKEGNDSLPDQPGRPRQWTEHDLAQTAEECAWMIPALRGAKLRSILRGFPVDTPDTHPYIGETELPGFYLVGGCNQHGANVGPGLGKLTAELITTGRTSLDIRPWRLSRFQ